VAPDVAVMLTQRWRQRRDSFRPGSEPFEPDRYEVEPVEQALARPFVEQHHYSGSYPAARLAVGLWRRRRLAARELVGVAVFSVPMSQAVIPKYSAGLKPAEGVELGRLVLLDEVPGNAESFFCARAFDLVRSELGDKRAAEDRTASPDVRVVVSFSDPLRRVADDGRVVMPGHCGIVYQALSAQLVGRTNRATLILGSGGRVVSNRMLAKLRGDKRGAAYAYEALRGLGAPRRRLGESGVAYVRRALDDAAFRRVRHPGNFAYIWPIGGAGARRKLRRRFEALPSLPYPKPAADLVLG